MNFWVRVTKNFIKKKKMLNAKLEYYLIGQHALPHEDFIYIFIYIYIYID